MNDRITILALFLHNSLWTKRIRGDERRFLEIAKRLRKLGVDLCVMEFAPSLQKSYYNTRIYRSIELQSQKLTYLISHVALSVLRLRKRYDVIYVNNQDLYNVLSVLILRLIQRKPTIAVVQSLQDIELSLRTLKALYGASPLDLLIVYIHKKLLHVFFKLVDVIVTTTNTLRNVLILKFPWIEKKVFVTGNGVDLNKFKPMNLEKKYNAIFLGRIHILHKNLDKLLLAWRIVINKLPKARLVLVGGYESNRDRELLSSLLDKLSLKENAIVTGFVEDEEVVTILNSSKFFISLSTHEGFGLSLLEAMACGLPCVVSSLQVFKELHGNLLFYVNTQDHKNLASIICKLLMLHDSNLNSLKTALRAHTEKFSWDIVARRELSLILRLSKKHAKEGVKGYYISHYDK